MCVDPELSQRYAVRFAGNDVMDTDGELSNDLGATWQHDFTMSSTRVGPVASRS